MWGFSSSDNYKKRRAQTAQGPDCAGPILRKARTAQRTKGGERRYGEGLSSGARQGIQHFHNDHEQIVNGPVLVRCNALSSEIRVEVPNGFFCLPACDSQKPRAIGTRPAPKTLRDIGGD